MQPYKWVSSGSISKFNRANLEFTKKNQELQKQGKDIEPITEERLKARYIEMNGLIVEKTPVDNEPEVQDENGAEEGSADKPRRGRPAKNA